MKKFTFIVILGSMIMSSCEDKIDVDLPVGEVRLVIDALYTNEQKEQSILLTTTSPYFEDGATPRESGATVYLVTDLGDTINFPEDNARPGYYVSNTPAEEGRSYTLHIRSSEGDIFESYPEKANRNSPIDSIYFIEEPEDRGPFEEGWAVYINTKEPEGEGDYYRWIYYADGVLGGEPEDLTFASDEFVDGNDVNDLLVAQGLEEGQFIQISQLAITERAYNYWILVQEQTVFSGGPFDPPPAPIPSNVMNLSDETLQPLGLFSVATAENAEILIDP